MPAGDPTKPTPTFSLPLSLRASASLSVGVGNEGVLKGPILHRTFEVVVHTPRLGEEPPSNVSTQVLNYSPELGPNDKLLKFN